MLKPVLKALTFAALAAVQAAAQVPAGGEFLANTTTTGFQGLPAVSADPSGAFVVVWVHEDNAPNYGVRGRRFDASGAPRGAEFRIDVLTSGRASLPAVASDDRGGFVVAWFDTAGDGSGYAILARRYDASGAPRSGEFVANSYTTFAQASPSVAFQPGGAFVIAWHSGDESDSFATIKARRFDSAANPLGPEFTVNTYTTGRQRTPSLDSAPDGRFVAVWTSLGQDGSGYGVFSQRFDAAGARVGAEFRVNTYTSGHQDLADVAMAPDGSFVVAWMDKGSFPQTARGRHYDSSGTPTGSEFVVTTFSNTITYFMAADSDSGGNFTVVWETLNEDGDSFGVSGRRFGASGVPRGAVFRVNSQVIGAQFFPDLASDPSGNLVATWATTPAGSDVAAQRYGGLVAGAMSVADGANGVLEVADTFTLLTSWRNVNGAAQTFQGRASGVSAPPGLQLTLSADANYGTVPNGALGQCSAPCFAGALSGTRPAGHVDAGFTESLLPDAQGQTKRWSLHVGDSFSDVPRANIFYRFVETLVHHSITGGCTGGAYCPTAATTREQMAIFVLLAKEGRGYLPPACTTPIFSDVPASSPYCRWIEELARRGVVGGCTAQNYCPMAAVTREQMPIFVLRTLDPTLNPPACTTPMFADVPASSIFCRWIEELVRRGVVTGCGGGNYCPTSAVTREQMGVFISVTFGLTLYGP